MNNLPVNLHESCELYTSSIKKTLNDLFNVTVQNGLSVNTTNSLEETKDLYFSILFTGKIYGEFLIGINRKTALEMLGISTIDQELGALYEANRNDIIDTFKELINIAAGRTLRTLKTHFPEISITPPRAIEGTMILSNFSLTRAQLVHSSGDMLCYIYIDAMKLDVVDAFEQEQLKQEELKRLNRAKSEFLANMSHELRTPLNGMIGMLDLLKSTHLDTAQKEQVGVIYKSGEFLLSLISDILEFSKIEAGKLNINIEKFELIETLESVVESIAFEVFKKGLDFKIDLSTPGPLYIDSDRTRIKQVLVNLIGNAIKFTPTGSIELSLEDKGSSLLFSVTDTGVGIPENKLKTIFDSFSQADLSDTRRYGGSGLGLTICKNILEALGGNIKVTSREAMGSTFEFEIPIQQQSPSSDPEEVYDFAWPSIATNEGGNNELLQKWKITENANSKNLLIRLNDWQHLEPAAKSKLLETKQVVVLAKPTELNSEAAAEKAPGVRFLRLPLLPNRLRQVLTKASHPPDSLQHRPADLKHLKILVAEDNSVNQLVIASMLEHLGHTAVIVENGELAYHQMVHNTWDLVLMDCQMPTMTGFAATEKFRQFEKTLNQGRLPIVALTANALRETKAQCFECGMDEFTTKPIQLEELARVIDKTMLTVGKAKVH